jgi:hypothetical protein
MAPIVPDPKKIKSFRTEAAFEAWLAANHARETELWLKVHKKGSGLPTVTCAQALDVGCVGGGLTASGRPSTSARSCNGSRRAERGASGARSTANTSRLTAAGRVTLHGQRRRTKKIATLVAMLERGETIVPERRR